MRIVISSLLSALIAAGIVTATAGFLHGQGHTIYLPFVQAETSRESYRCLLSERGGQSMRRETIDDYIRRYGSKYPVRPGTIKKIFVGPGLDETWIQMSVHAQVGEGKHEWRYTEEVYIGCEYQGNTPWRNRSEIPEG